MPRAKGGFKTRRRRKKILDRAKGFRGGKRTRIKLAAENVDRALVYQYRDRKNKKRDFRKLWIARLGIAARANGISYRELIFKLKKAQVVLDRKILSEIAVNDPKGFSQVVEFVKGK